MKKLKQFARLVAINSIVLLLLLLLVEIVLRIAGMGYGDGPVDADPVLNFVRPANYQYKKYSVSGDYGHFMVYFDSLGRRAPLPDKAVKPSSNTKPVVFIGDSFVETFEVPYDSSFIGHLANRFPNYAFLNYGMGRYSPVLHYLRCKKMLNEHNVNPALVIMVVTSNDVREDSGYLSRAVYDTARHEIIAVDGGKKNWFKSFIA